MALICKKKKKKKKLFLTYFSHFLITREKLQKFRQHISDSHTECVNRSASLKEHFFFLGKLYVSFEKVYNYMIGNIISFYRIFVLCNLEVWFRNYGKSCEVPPNLFGLIH